MECQQSILAGIHQFLVDLDTRVRGVLSNLSSAQAVIILNGNNNPFSRLNMEDFDESMAKLKQEVEEQRQRRREIEESIRSSRWWHNTFNAAFTVVTVGVILGSVVLAAYMKVHVAVIAVTAAPTVMKTVEQWVSSIWEQQNNALKEKKMAVEKKQGTLQVLFSYDHLEILPSLVQNVNSNVSALAAALLRQEVGNDTVESMIGELKTDTNLVLWTAHECIQIIRRAEREIRLINNNR